MTGQRGGLVADAFHQVAVAGDDIGGVIDQPGAETRGQQALAQGHADGGRDALAERPGGGLDAGGEAVFRMPRGAAAELAEIADLVDRHVGVAGQIEQRIKQHRAVPGGQDEAVAVGPVGRRGIELEEPAEQHRGDIGHAHGHAGMARPGGLDRIHGESPDCVGHQCIIDFHSGYFSG